MTKWTDLEQHEREVARKCHETVWEKNGYKRSTLQKAIPLLKAVFVGMAITIIATALLT